MSRYHYRTDIIGSANALDAQLQPDIMLPKQYADFGRSVHRTPEQLLWLSVLESGIEDARLGPGVTDRAYQRWAKARLWVEDEDDSVGSFVFCCQVLNLGADRLRKAVLGGLGRVSFMRRPHIDTRVQPKEWRER